MSGWCWAALAECGVGQLGRLPACLPCWFASRSITKLGCTTAPTHPPPQISVLPRCTGVVEVLEAHTLWEAAALFLRAGWGTVAAILGESYVSLATLAIVFAAFLGLCRSGGIGAVPGESWGTEWQGRGWQ